MRDTATLFDKLMLGLGFGDGYLAQGGDIGYLVSMIIGGDAESCKGQSDFAILTLADIKL